VYADLGEDGGIAQRCEDSFEPEATREIQLTRDPILEAQVEPVATQGLYLYDIPQHDLTLAVESAPAARALEPNPNSLRVPPDAMHGSRLDLQYSPVLSVSHMEVPWRMIVIIHGHDDTEESTDLGHPDEAGVPGARTCHPSAAGRIVLLRVFSLTSQHLAPIFGPMLTQDDRLADLIPDYQPSGSRGR